MSTGLQCTQPSNKKDTHALYASHIPNKTKESPCYLTQSQPPWEKVGIDYFSFGGKDNLLVMDYYLKYPEVVQIHSKTAETTIAELKSIFARHGIPSEIMLDNMPFNSRAFKQFSYQ